MSGKGSKKKATTSSKKKKPSTVRTKSKAKVVQKKSKTPTPGTPKKTKRNSRKNTNNDDLKMNDNNSNGNSGNNPTKELEDSIFSKLRELDGIKLMQIDEDKEMDDDNDDNDDYPLKLYDLNDKSNKDKVKALFDIFHENLTKQCNKLMAKFDDDSDDNKQSTLYIDEIGTNKFISEIGNIKFKTFEDLKREQEKYLQKLKEIMAIESEINAQNESHKDIKQRAIMNFDFVNNKKKVIEDKLYSVKPLIKKAKESVLGIKKSHIDELRALRSPPKIVQKVIHCGLYFIYGIKTTNKDKWQDIRKNVTFKFVQSILDYDTLQLLNEDGYAKMKYIYDHFFIDPEFTFERANIASKVAGPLISFIDSQIKYAKVLGEVKPLIDEIDKLKDEVLESEAKMKEVIRIDNELNKKIKKCRGEMLRMIGYIKVGHKYMMHYNVNS